MVAKLGRCWLETEVQHVPSTEKPIPVVQHGTKTTVVSFQGWSFLIPVIIKATSDVAAVAQHLRRRQQTYRRGWSYGHQVVFIGRLETQSCVGINFLFTLTADRRATVGKADATSEWM